ncbi:MAG: alpha/beta fold hydrolase [Ilumatobacteraceae bacterium]
MARDEIELHGRRVAFERRGTGPVVVLLHGLAATMRTWDRVAPALAADATVITLDLPGFGRSTPPSGDHSLGASANAVRDLLDALDLGPATIVGHSLGGGIAMQFAYQFPRRCERLVLVSSGGLGPEVGLPLRAATIPGAELLIGLVARQPLVAATTAIGRAAAVVGIRPGAALTEYLQGCATFVDDDARRAFVKTLRAVVDHRGQRISATDRLHLADQLPTLIIWGTRDRLIPAHHAHAAHAQLPASRLELFEGAGHVPHATDPARFTCVLLDFLATTQPRRLPRVTRCPTDPSEPAPSS